MVSNPEPATTHTPVALTESPPLVPARTLTPDESTEIPLAPSTEIASAATVIPLPAPTSNVTAPVVPPPVKPLPAVTAVISPVGSAQ